MQREPRCGAGRPALTGRVICWQASQLVLVGMMSQQCWASHQPARLLVLMTGLPPATYTPAGAAHVDDLLRDIGTAAAFLEKHQQQGQQQQGQQQSQQHEAEEQEQPAGSPPSPIFVVAAAHAAADYVQQQGSMPALAAMLRKAASAAAVAAAAASCTAGQAAQAPDPAADAGCSAGKVKVFAAGELEAAGGRAGGAGVVLWVRRCCG